MYLPLEMKGQPVLITFTISLKIPIDNSLQCFFLLLFFFLKILEQRNRLNPGEFIHFMRGSENGGKSDGETLYQDKHCPWYCEHNKFFHVTGHLSSYQTSVLLLATSNFGRSLLNTCRNAVSYSLLLRESIF